MWRILVVVVVAGCPAPAPPPAERPSPPPAVVAVDAAAEPVVPAVLAVRAGSGVLELVRVDADGEARVLHELGRTGALPAVADLAVDPASGRYAVLVEADTVDGTVIRAPRNVMSLVLGELDGGLVAAVPADPACVMHRCFEQRVAIAPGGATIVTTRHRTKASDLARYDFGPAPAPTALDPRRIEKPALSPDHARLAYQQGGAIHVVDLGSAAAAPPVVGRATDVAAIALGESRLVYRTRAGIVEVVDLDTQATRTVARLAADPRPALRLAGDELLTTDAGSVVAVPLDGGDPRVLASGALIDVSADGAWVLVDDDALSVIAVADGRAAARHDVPAALGQVRARLAP